jgi:DNA topoisomerase-1
VNLIPDDIKKSLTAEQYRLYKLIWSRFLSSQMASAVYDSVTIDVLASGYLFRANHSSIKFSGFTAVYEEGRDEEGEAPQSPLPDLKEGELVNQKELRPAQHFTQPPARYSEATLIRALEEKGIGRPSTYAPTISTIMDREYVVKEGKYLRTTPLGEVVTTLMKDKFSKIVDPAFTAGMEEELDHVEEGEENWKTVLARFYQDFHATMEKAETELDGERIKIPDEVSEEICDLCGRNLVIKSGRFGRFLACPGYPDCTFTKPLVVEMPGKCPKCQGRILKKTSRNGYTYYGCEFNGEKNGEKACDFMTWDVPVKENCPECGHTLFKKSGKGAKKPYCINEACGNFTPEDKRGGFKKKAPADQQSAETGEAQETAKAGKAASAKGKGTAKKATAKKAPAKKATAKKAPAKKEPAKNAAPKKTAAKKTAAKKTAAKKTAAKPKKTTASGKGEPS